MEWNHWAMPALTHNFSECRGCISHHRGVLLLCSTVWSRFKKMSMQAWSFNLHMDKVIGTFARAYIGTGDYDAAFMQASAALNVEPVNGESYLSMGLVKQCQKDYGAASEYYQKAIQWGLNDSLITSLYLMPLWSYTDHSDKILAFWERTVESMAKRLPNLLFYWTCISKSFKWSL